MIAYRFIHLFFIRNQSLIEPYGSVMKCVDKYNIHIKFLVKRKHYFFIEAVMRLRHKKPLNPYKGQTNNDKNEFNDDDFKQQGSPHKKTPNGSTDQIYKYAKILTKFIKTVNQEYNQYEQLHGQPPDPKKYNNTKPIPIDLEDQIPINIPHRKQQIKQHKQAPKLQEKKEVKEEIKETRATSRKKDTNQPTPSVKENKNKALDNSAQDPIDLTRNSIMSKNAAQVSAKIEKDPKPSKNESFNQTFSKLPPKTTPNPGFNTQNIKLNGLQSIGVGLNANVPNFLNMQGLLNANQLLSMEMYAGLNPVQFGQMAQMAQLGQIPMQFPSLNGMNYMPMNMSMMGMPNQPPPPQPVKRPFYNLFIAQFKAYNPGVLPHEKMDRKQAFPLKRAAYHITIAYKIYFDNLRYQVPVFHTMEEIEPTRFAKKIKSSQKQGKLKQQQKKKK